MARETVKGTRQNGVYKVNQRTGEMSYEGQYGGRGSQSIRNSIRTVGARQAARTASAYRTNSGSSASRGGVTSFMGPSQNEYRQYARFSNGSSRISSRSARRG